MKVHVYGNILNNGYNVTRFLRDAGYDATLFLDHSSSCQQDYPWWEDTHLTPEVLPEWIRYYPFNPKWFVPGLRERRLFADFGNADVALVSSWGPILAARAGIPFVFYSYGEDLNIADTKFGVGKILRVVLRGGAPRGIRKYLTIGLLQRQSVKKAEYVAIAMGYQKTHLAALGLLSKMAKVRLAWDVSKYLVPTDAALESRYSGYHRVFFMISRHSWHSLARDLKGNDKFIRAFARYVHANRANVILLLIDKGQDVGRSRRLVRELGIQTYVHWLPEMNKDGIRAFLSLRNVVVVDQFWHDEWHRLYSADRANSAVVSYVNSDGQRPTPLLKHQGLSLIGFGSGSIEALSAGRLLITAFFEHDFYDGEDPPIFGAFSEAEILDALLQIHTMTPEEMTEMGERAKEFVKRFHSWQNVLPLYTSLIERTYAQRAAEEGTC